MKNKEMNKKGKAIAQILTSEDSDIVPLFSYTTCNKECGSLSWEEMYQFFEDEKPIVMDKVASVELSISLDHIFFDIACHLFTR